MEEAEKCINYVSGIIRLSNGVIRVKQNFCSPVAYLKMFPPTSQRMKSVTVAFSMQSELSAVD